MVHQRHGPDEGDDSAQAWPAEIVEDFRMHDEKPVALRGDPVTNRPDKVASLKVAPHAAAARGQVRGV
ncbi:MAG TPA: hypothetical protein VE136_15005 [Anaerolineales bacterium]|nr:hypothetical protein [Anaerolineales bacterium]